MEVTLIGDVHGNLVPIQASIGDKLPIIQLGDLGFADTYRKLSYRLARYPSAKFMLVGGNHDCYPYLQENSPSWYLGDFGIIPGTESTFFVRGAYSYDHQFRTLGKDLWVEEELDFAQRLEAIEAYQKLKPRIVLSHDAPYTICASWIHWDSPSRTHAMLEMMLRYHAPEMWFFGHHHHSWKMRVGTTMFQCLGIDERVKVDLP